LHDPGHGAGAAIGGGGGAHPGAQAGAAAAPHPGAQAGAATGGGAHDGAHAGAGAAPHPGAQAGAAAGGAHPGAQAGAAAIPHPGAQAGAAAGIHPGMQAGAASIPHPGIQAGAAAGAAIRVTGTVMVLVASFSIFLRTFGLGGSSWAAQAPGGRHCGTGAHPTGASAPMHRMRPSPQVGAAGVHCGARGICGAHPGWQAGICGAPHCGAQAGACEAAIPHPGAQAGACGAPHPGMQDGAAIGAGGGMHPGMQAGAAGAPHPGAHPIGGAGAAIIGGAAMAPHGSAAMGGGQGASGAQGAAWGGGAHGGLDPSDSGGSSPVETKVGWRKGLVKSYTHNFFQKLFFFACKNRSRFLRRKFIYFQKKNLLKKNECIFHYFYIRFKVCSG